MDPNAAEEVTLDVQPQAEIDCAKVSAINSKYILLKYDLEYFKNNRSQNTLDKNKSLLANILAKLHNITQEMATNLSTEEKKQNLQSVRTLLASVRDGTADTRDAVNKQLPTHINQTSADYKALLGQSKCAADSLVLCPYNKLGNKIPADMTNMTSRRHYEIQARLGHIDLKPCNYVNTAAPIEDKVDAIEPELEQAVPAAPGANEETVIAQ